MLGSAAEVGYVLERKIFDRVLAQNAAREGAEVMVKMMATGLIRRNGYVSGVKARCTGDEYEIDAEIVIGADGVESKVGRWAGIDTSRKLHDIETCIQFLMTNIHVDQDYCEFFLGNEVAPGGYAWIFPKGDGTANVGLGIAGDRGKRPMDYLKKIPYVGFPMEKS
jgi:digeranylgeranylglycerophospholipid reductase